MSWFEVEFQVCFVSVRKGGDPGSTVLVAVSVASGSD